MGAAAAAAGLALLLGLQLLRVYLPLATFYLYDALGLSPLITALASLVFVSAGFAAPALARRLGWARSVAATAATLALLRGAEQWVRAPVVDVWLAAAGTALLCVLLALLLLDGRGDGRRRLDLTLWLLAALATETTVRTLAATLDLSWRADPVSLGLVLAICLATLATAFAAARTPTAAPGSAAPPWSWLALGSWLALYLLVFSNPASLAARASMPLDRAGVFVLVSWALALLVTAVRWRPGSLAWSTGESLALTALGVWAALAGGSTAWFGHLVGAPAMAVVLLDLLAASDGRSGRAVASGGAGPAMLLAVYLCYGRFDQGFSPTEGTLYAGIVAALAAASLAAAWGRRPLLLSPARRLAAVGPALLVGLAAAAAWLLAPSPATTVPAGDSVRVLTYNLHQGFDTEGRLDPEALARVIESEAADVLALQEVARGWLVTGGLDLHAALIRRLRMPGVFAGTADAMWGNAVLSRLPLLEVRRPPLPPRDLPLKRGVLDVTLDAGNRPLRVLCLHLHHRRADDGIRLRQTEALLELWGGSPATLLLGDFNALPSSEPIRLLRAAGLADASALLPASGRSTISRPGSPRQIDWIFATADLALEAASVPYSTASDHLAVAVTVRFRTSTGVE